MAYKDVHVVAQFYPWYTLVFSLGFIYIIMSYHTPQQKKILNCTKVKKGTTTYTMYIHNGASINAKMFSAHAITKIKPIDKPVPPEFHSFHIT